MTDQQLVHEVITALGQDPHIDLRQEPIAVIVHDGHVTLEGEVSGMAPKRRAVEVAARCAGVADVEDSIRLRPSESMADGVIREHLCNALLNEIAFKRHGLMLIGADNSIETARARPAEPEGNIAVLVENGEVTLEGTVPSLSHRRFAGVLAWWVPGTTQVHNHLEPAPFYADYDRDGELEEVIRIVLEKDRLVQSDQIMVRSGGQRVTLSGVVPSSEQRNIAEHDVWFVEGVRDLVNELRVP